MEAHQNKHTQNASHELILYTVCVKRGGCLNMHTVGVGVYAPLKTSTQHTGIQLSHGSWGADEFKIMGW